MAYVIVNIGSNLGDRRLNLSRAVAAITNHYGDFEVSHAIESESQGYESENKFLNICLMFQSDETPQEVLETLREIEQRLNPEPHRNSDGSYRDRTLDIDIVAIDDVQLFTPELTLPHPRLAERRFFLEPLKEVAPGWHHPATGLTADEMLSKL